MDIGEARRLVGRQIARENEGYVLKELPWFLVHAEILHGHGVIPDLEEAQWTLEAPSGELLTVRLTPVAPGEEVRWVSAAQAVPLYRQRPEEDLWHTFLPESGTLYVGFRGYPARPVFQKLFDEVFGFADRKRLVIDLHENTGGGFTRSVTCSCRG